jgi:hypothetical protein
VVHTVNDSVVHQISTPHGVLWAAAERELNNTVEVLVLLID